jgi:hypothetical protein
MGRSQLVELFFFSTISSQHIHVQIGRPSHYPIAQKVIGPDRVLRCRPDYGKLSELHHLPSN